MAGSKDSSHSEKLHVVLSCSFKAITVTVFLDIANYQIPLGAKWILRLVYFSRSFQGEGHTSV